jgi:hypothetical protein
MRLRRVVTLTVFTSFFFLALSGIGLFLSPQGRVAYWSGWRLLGLTKQQFSALHTTFMLLFLIVAVWHIVYNWKPIKTYLKDRAKKVRIFTPEFTVALVLCLVFVAGTLTATPPFAQFLNAADDIKGYWEARDGSPPWGHAEQTPLCSFCRKMEGFERVEHTRHVTIDCEEAASALRAAGIKVDDTSTPLIEIASANSTTPQALAEIVLSVAREREVAEEVVAAESVIFPKPYSGLGRMSLREYTEKYDIDLDLALSIANSRGIELDPDAKLRDESRRHGTNPEGLLYLLNKGPE